ncbi:MAG: cellulase family glycosylhydrolase [Clostridiales bacterium]
MKYLNIILVLILCLALNLLKAQGFLKASGKKIINSQTGQEFYLKGIGLGGWLVPEGYMLQTPGDLNSPTRIKNAIESLIGKTNTDLFFQTYYKNYVNKKDIDQIAKWGFNSIRLPLHYKLLAPPEQPGVYSEEGFKMIDSALSWCEQNHLYLILDLHTAPGAQSKDNISDSDGEARLWTEPNIYQPRTIALWKEIARRYADKEWIGGYDLINETAYNLPNNNSALRNLFINITNAIREVDKNHILFVEGNWYATDFSGLTPTWDNNMAYSFHKYWNQTDVGTIQYLLNIRDQYNAPLWLGETGENSNQWFAECIELMKKYDIGWAWWPHKKMGAIAGPLSAPITPEYQKVLDYWKGNGTVSSAFAANALITMAQNLALEKCEYHKDVIDAIIRQPGTTQTIPFADNNIPGRIYAPDYDLGKQDIAYKDNDYKNTNQGAAYNSGYAYRNDGVDIEKCSDSFSNGYNLGWINSGEWVGFTVNVARTDMYSISLRVASNATGGRALLKLDGFELGKAISIPKTGGYQTWQSVTYSDSIQIPAGKHFLQVCFTTGGYNFNSVDFTGRNLTGSTSYDLKQNYPNPFNPATKIEYVIPEKSIVSLKVYDVLGRNVATLVSEEQMDNQYSLVFDASKFGLSSGTYFYKLQAGNFIKTKKLTYIK